MPILPHNQIQHPVRDQAQLARSLARTYIDHYFNGGGAGDLKMEKVGMCWIATRVPSPSEKGEDEGFETYSVAVGPDGSMLAGSPIGPEKVRRMLTGVCLKAVYRTANGTPLLVESLIKYRLPAIEFFRAPARARKGDVRLKIWTALGGEYRVYADGTTVLAGKVIGKMHLSLGPIKVG